MSNKDSLDIAKTPQLVNNEKVFLSCNITKYNDYGFRQERILVLTNEAIYNINKKKIKKRIPYKELEAISMSTMSSEFVLHIKNSNDYRFLSFKQKNEIVEEILKILCLETKLCTAFPVYNVPMINLQSVMTSHSLHKQGKQILPDKQYLQIMDLDKYHNQ